jgi:membrane-bound lytic murein transglycosylase D
MDFHRKIYYSHQSNKPRNFSKARATDISHFGVLFFFVFRGIFCFLTYHRGFNNCFLKHVAIVAIFNFPLWLHAERTDTTKILNIDKSIVEDKQKNNIEISKNSKSNKIIEFPDIYYEYRIENLDKNSPVKLDYNADVRKYIDLYIEKRPEKIAEFLGLKDLYFPIFEEYLDKYNLPLELKYLPIIESGLNPLAQSSSGAMGLWQLLLNSSKLLGLEVSSYKDERCDPYLSTDAACRYLKYLFSVFNDWQLALAAYNGGPGEVRKAIVRSGGKTNFWQIQPYLPEQTKWYVPAFIAVVYLANHAKEHGIAPKPPVINYNSVDTLMIHEELEFSKIVEKIGVPLETLRFLNPCYRRDIIADVNKPQSLVLPSDKIIVFLKIENQIFSRTNDTVNYLDVLSVAGDTAGKTKQFYTVKAGDFLHKIAMQSGCTLENLRAWNNLTNDNLDFGKILIIWTKGDDRKNETVSPPGKNKSQRYFYYTVKRGDTMWGIANRFKCDSINAIKVTNNLKSDHDLKPGQKLKILVSN